MSDVLLASIRAAMQPLAERFGLRIEREQQERNYGEVLYLNDTTGLSVAVDWSEFRPFVKLYQLEEGKLPSEPVSYNTTKPLKSFDADDLLLRRGGPTSPVGKMLGERNEVAARRLLSEYAVGLERYASDVLSGDFAVFTELDGVVKARAQDMKMRRA